MRLSLSLPPFEGLIANRSTDLRGFRSANEHRVRVSVGGKGLNEDVIEAAVTM